MKFGGKTEGASDASGGIGAPAGAPSGEARQSRVLRGARHAGGGRASHESFRARRRRRRENESALMQEVRRERKQRRRAIAARIVYVVILLALCVVFPVFVNSAIGYVPLFLLVFLVLISFVYLRLIIPKLDYQQNTNYQECIRGEEDVLEIALKNTSPLLFFRLEPTVVVSDLDGEEGEQTTMRCTLDGHEERTFGIDVAFDHVGVYTAGLRKVEIFDLLGLFSKVVPIEERCRVRVVPRVYDLDSIGVIEMTTTENLRSLRSVLSDDMDYAYVRDYEQGDPMKTVHWKLSARNEEHLYTKLFESHTNPGIEVIFDFRCTDESSAHRLDIFDTMLEAGFSIIDFARRAGIESSVVFRDSAGRVRNTEENDVRALDAMIDDMPRPNNQVPAAAAGEMIESEMRNPDAEANFLFFTSDLSDTNINAILRCKMARRGIKVFAVMPKGLASDERSARLRPLQRLDQAQVVAAALETGADTWKVTQ